MHFNYDGRDWQFLARIMDQSSQRLSRTRSGVSDTSASKEKQPLLLAGEPLQRQSAENERRVFQWIMETRTDPPPADAASVRQVLFTIADETNRALLPAGRLRKWNVPYPRHPVEEDGFRPGTSRRIPPDELEHGLEEFCQTIHGRWSELSSDPVPLAAWVEWHLNPGPLHPFYDGCGRNLPLLRRAHSGPFHQFATLVRRSNPVLRARQPGSPTICRLRPPTDQRLPSLGKLLT